MPLFSSLTDIVQQNIDYWRTEAYSFAAMHACGYTVSYMLYDAHVKNETNAIVTFVAKTAVFAAVKLITYNDERMKSLGSLAYSSAISSIGAVCHGLLLTRVPDTIAYPLGYGIPGIFSNGVRWIRDLRKTETNN